MSFDLKQLARQHVLAATLFACGHSWAEVSPLVGLKESYLRIIASQSPLFKAEIQRIYLKMQSRVLDDATAKLEGEALRSVEKLIDIRDNAVSISEQRRAADSILDRIPRLSKTQRHLTSESGSISISDEQVERMLADINDDPLAREAFERAARMNEMIEMLGTEDVIDLTPDEIDQDAEFN